MTTVALVGTLDTKGAEFRWMRERLEAAGVDVHLIDVGVMGPAPLVAETPRDTVARAGGVELDNLRAAADRAAALAVMARGAAAITKRLATERRIHGLLMAGGGGGSSVAAAVMQALPIGFPKLLVSTMAAGDVRPYVGSVDVTLMYSVVDIAGINRISAAVLGNAVEAIASMARAADRSVDIVHERPLIGATMFGLTTPGVDAARAALDAIGYEVVVFHATGSGGRSLEALAADGFLDGVLDITTTELADEYVGGVLSAGPDRLTAAGRVGLPQVVSLGALDMVNFAGRASVPPAYAGRRLHMHNEFVTLMRTTADECRAIGEDIARKLVASAGPAVMLIPLRGISALDIEGGPFADPAADRALFDAVRAGLAGTRVAVEELDLHINDPEFGLYAARRLAGLIKGDTQ